MLARIAYQVYWIGRYVARAEFTARMLDGVFQASIQAQGSAARQPLSWEAVMAVMGADTDGPGPVPASDAVRALTLDPESPASVTACIDRARAGARTVRDVVSTEMWEALNTLFLELNDSDLGAALRTGPYSVYSFVRERCALWWGLADETMLRDGSYFFLGAGRHSESAEMIVRMLRVALSGRDAGSDPAAGGDSALALLQAVGGLEAFRRSVPTPVGPGAGGGVPDVRDGLPALGRGVDRRAPERARRRRHRRPRRATGAATGAAARGARISPGAGIRRGDGG